MRKNENFKVLVSAPYLQSSIDRFKNILVNNNIEIILVSVKEHLSENELLPIIENIDGVICGDDYFTEEVIKRAKKLRVISKWGTGIDTIDQDACKKYGIKLYNTPNAFTEPVSDTVIGFILCYARNIILSDQEIKKGKWNKVLGFALHEKILGIIGVGNIGKAVVKKAKNFGIKILGNDIKQIPEEFISETGIIMVEKGILYKNSDIISINCDLNETSYHLINMNSFNLMKKKPFIINTARGSIINEKDLILALENGLIAGAALDVFENEPIEKNNPLLKFKNVILSPHNSNSSMIAWEKVHKTTISNLIKGLNDK